MEPDVAIDFGRGVRVNEVSTAGEESNLWCRHGESFWRGCRESRAQQSSSDTDNALVGAPLPGK
jgi:hypothetical protein